VERPKRMDGANERESLDRACQVRK
jgi:hypothetical protein